MKIRKAIISVSDKTGLIELATELEDRQVEIYSTGGTLKQLVDAGIRARSVEAYTQFPEILDGRVKTLHPKIHAGILARHDVEEDMMTLRRLEIELFDLVCINLYPFEKATADLVNKGSLSSEELAHAIENIDIGGPSMIRAAAKNYRFTAVLCDPAQYAGFLGQLAQNDGGVSEDYLFTLSRQAFEQTAMYDAMISSFLQNLQKPGELPDHVIVPMVKKQDLRYGENPHQQAAFYSPLRPKVAWQVLQGKELSYNNLLDMDAAIRFFSDFERPVCAIFKHTNPCGISAHTDMKTSYHEAVACDPVSHFGGIIAFNREVDGATAADIAPHFYEIIVAPGFSDAAKEIFAKKKNLRLVVSPAVQPKLDLRSASGGFLLQNSDTAFVTEADLKVVSARKPDASDIAELLFAFGAVRHIKSNAILFTRNFRSLAVGAGQMSRLDSIEIAVSKAKKAGLELKDCYLASDAFFPFRDGVDAAIAAGAKAIIQPGGSLRDEESIAAADEAGVIMVVTGMRHFRH